MPAMVGFRFALQDAVELDALPRREAQRAVARTCRQMSSIARYWSAVSFPPGILQPDHEHVRLADAGLVAVLAGVAVFLLVAAVELDEALVDLAEMLDRGIDQLLGERAAKIPPLASCAPQPGRVSARSEFRRSIEYSPEGMGEPSGPGPLDRHLIRLVLSKV